VENVEVMEDNHIKFDFLGKDSIRYENEVAVHPKVHSLVRSFCSRGKGNKGRPIPLCLLLEICHTCASA
jgi:DNA topoisomerase-1